MIISSYDMNYKWGSTNAWITQFTPKTSLHVSYNQSKKVTRKIWVDLERDKRIIWIDFD